MTARYGIPYFSNFVNSDMSPEDARSMCCRLRLDNRELRKRGGGLFGANPLTGSIGVVTINLPRIGYLSNSEEEFFSRLKESMEMAKESLEIKRRILESFTEKGLYPYAKFFLKNIKEKFGKYWQNHFSTIGLIGMNEAMINFLGYDITHPDSKQFSLKILKFMREEMMNYQNQTNHLYNLEATPGEGTSFRLAKKDEEFYPEIKNANVNGGTPYYTNSSQLPVGYTEDLFQALDLQDGFQTQYTGGTVFHGFLGEKMPDAESVKKIIKVISEKYKLPYYTLTPTFSICPNHGYLPGEQKKCKECGAECEVWSRIVGYLRPVGNWNDGKKAEYKMRKTYKVPQLVLAK